MRRSKPWLSAIIIGLILAAAILTGTVQAQDGGPQPTPSDDEVNDIAEQMFCPVCENIPLDVCGTQACAQWREQIREKLAEGWTEEEIKDYFVQLYGDRVLSAPPRRGLNWVIYVLPPLAFVAGAYVLIRGIRGWQSPTGSSDEESDSKETASDQDEYVSRLEEELKKRN